MKLTPKFKEIRKVFPFDLEGIENKQRLQTLSIDNAWSNKSFLYYFTFRMLQHTSSEGNGYNCYKQLKNTKIKRGTGDKIKNRYAMRTCVCYLEIIIGYVVLSWTVQNVCFVGFVWCHVCFAALKIKETVGKIKLKSLKDKVSSS